MTTRKLIGVLALFAVIATLAYRRSNQPRGEAEPE